MEQIAVIDEAVARIVAEMNPVKVILFGSAARGNMKQESDIDLMVILDRVDDHHAEINRAYAAIRPLRVYADVLVFSEQELEGWADVVGHVINDALTEGRILYDAA